MSEIKKILEIANAEVGYLEKSKVAYVNNPSVLDDKTAGAGSDNFTKYARDIDNIPNFYNGKKQGYAWCDVFVDWCFVQAFGVQRAMELLNQPEKSTGAGCGFSMNFYKKINQFFTAPKKGDQIFFKQGNNITHTGLVYDIDNSRVYTIEGNTSSASGVVANGGAVVKKSYNLNSSYIAGYGRPKYNGEVEPEEPKKDLIEEDGLWGRDTTRKAQKVFGTPIDGIVSNQFYAYKEENKGLLSSTFEWKGNPSREGSVLIKAIQNKIGVVQDGYIGTETIKGMQRWLGTPVDGVVSYPSVMVKAFQKWLNNQ